MVGYHNRTSAGRFPRLAVADRDALYRPVDQFVVYNSTAGRYQFYDAGFGKEIVATVDFVAATQTIEGFDFAAAGFVVNQWIVVGAESMLNSGEYQVTAVDANSLTVWRGDAALQDETVEVTIQGRFGWRDHTGEQSAAGQITSGSAPIELPAAASVASGTHTPP